MKYCTKCGAQIPEGAGFCINCGTPVNDQQGTSQAQGTAQSAANQYQQYGSQAAPQGGAQAGPQGTYNQYGQGQPVYHDPYKVVELPILNRGFTAIVGYLSWLGFLIAMLAGDRKEPFARLHLNQALLINLAITVGLILEMIGTIIISNSMWSYYYSDGGYIGGTILSIIGVVLIIFSVVCWFIGLIRACRGRNKPVVLFGQWRLLK